MEADELKAMLVTLAQLEAKVAAMPRPRQTTPSERGRHVFGHIALLCKAWHADVGLTGEERHTLLTIARLCKRRLDAER